MQGPTEEASVITSQLFASQDVCQADPYEVRGQTDAIKTFSPCAGGSRAIVRKPMLSPSALSSSWKELGMQLCSGIASNAAPGGFEFFAELFASSDARMATLKEAGKRRWKLFPLPVDFEGCLLRETLTVTPSDGANPWTALVCMGLNWLSGEKVCGPRERHSAQVIRVVKNLQTRVSRFLSEEDEEVFDQNSLWADLISKRIGYDGEEVAEPVLLTFEQILKSAPPTGHGGSVPLSSLLVGRTKRQLEHPMECLLEEKYQTKGPNTAKVHICPGHEKQVWQLLVDRGIVEWFPLDKIHRNQDGPFLSGMF